MKSNSKNIERQAWAILFSTTMAEKICKKQNIFDENKINEMSENYLEKLSDYLNLSVPEDFDEVFTKEIRQAIDIDYLDEIEKQVDDVIERGNMMLSQEGVA